MSNSPATRGESDYTQLLIDSVADYCARALEPRPFELPRDHGPHPEFQTEWWYYTGNLGRLAPGANSGARAVGALATPWLRPLTPVVPDDQRFGFQLTFFRRGLAPGDEPDASLRTRQIYFAHFALTDVAEGRHRFAERFARGAGGLAGATGQPFAVWLEDWRAEATRPDGSAQRLVARDGGLSLDLQLEAGKPLVAHGDRGLSPKSAAAGNASYYVGYTRLSARGAVASQGGAPVEVQGQAWFDHEWSTSALGQGAVGWDWFSLQTDDGRELMYFQIRREDGSLEPVSGGTLVERDGSTRRVASRDLRLEVTRRWTSPETGATYPAGWRLALQAERLELEIEPWVEAQELRTSFVYWEGAVRVTGRRDGQPLRGQGYVELTGYRSSMQGVF